MIKRKKVVNDFFPEAESMRAAFDARVRDTYRQDLNWQYFCAPQMYTYLRTVPAQIFPKPMFGRFMQYLKEWCLENAGLIPTGDPNLHLMINGCTLALHSDFHNGTCAFVYSLTRWDTRKFSGGETLLLKDGQPSYKKHHVHGDSLYELVPARFNQLLLFDDRIVHGTQTIEGNMDPLEGRIAMVGHLRPTSPVVTGALDAGAVREVLFSLYQQVQERVAATLDYKDVQGTFSFRLPVAANGSVSAIAPLTDNLVTAESGYDACDNVEAVREIIQEELQALKFPPADGESSIIAALLIPVPDLCSIEIVAPHAAQPETLRELLQHKLREEGESLGFVVDMEAGVFRVREPLVGEIRIKKGSIRATFDPPMWVPSQRDQFQAGLKEKLGMLARMSQAVA
jgi:hypothetical protein